MKIISLDSSQRVPPMSPCPPLIINTVCPWLINPLSDPWDFNKSNGILLRSNWRKPYPKFYGSEFYGSGCVYLGFVKKTSQNVPTYLPGGGGLLIRCWHYVCMIMYVWLCMIMYEYVWVCMYVWLCMYDDVWLCMIMYVWLCMIMYEYVCMYDYVFMMMYDYVWWCMIMYDYVCLWMIIDDYMWLCVIM